MHISITHEQADFDALASLLGSWLFNEEIIPLLPRRMNRNCQAFISFYGPELPFVEIRDIPQEQVAKITLVDTQSFVTIRGINDLTAVEVIDHHPPRPDLPEAWNIITEKTGACTTLFVEHLHEIKKPLTSLQATLLLMGIYEDTGSLTFGGTTSRDMRAAAYLVEEGASLKLAMDYLNPPLTNGQRQVYDRLLSGTEHHNINGQKIIVARAAADDMAEEISIVAHKIRDLFDPDALFVLVTSDEGIRLVARSATDRVDVSAVATYFGGGGHSRAAAALIHPDEGLTKTEMLNKVYQELMEILPEFIHPPFTIGQIMSRHPLIIPPEMSAREAAQLMQRYGYEGYPVVKQGRVIGLLTRRAVDRALTHKLNLSVGSLMEANEIKVLPGDSLDHLQQIMIQSGWGQIPVVSPEDGEVIGIVTRTDLLKILSGNNSLVSGRKNLSEQLEAALPPERLALLKTISASAFILRIAAYIVGGFVRDLLLGRPGVDFDIVVEGDAIALGKSLANQFGGRVVAHKRFGTAKWQIKDCRPEIAEKLIIDNQSNPENLPESLDLISARTEFYEYPTALPTIERGSIKLDLHRRDFTINTLALRLDGRHYGELYDYYGGLHDMEKKLVRVLHSLSFVDDPTRMLRAVRFEKRFNFEIEPRTLQLMTEARSLLKQLSGSRLRHEFDLILEERQPACIFARMEELDLLQNIHPALTWKESMAVPLQQVLENSINHHWNLPETYGHYPIRKALAYLVWLLPLPESEIDPVVEKLRLPAAILNGLKTGKRLLSELDTLPMASVSQAVEHLESTSRPVLFTIYHSGIPEDGKKMIDLYLSKWQYIDIITDGGILKSMGIPPGPIYSRVLTTLRAARLDGKINSDEEEQALLQQMVRAIAPID